MVYTPGPGYVLPVGTHSLWVTFTPADSSGHTPQQASVTIVVTKGRRPSPGQRPPEIVYGTALDEAQLNATAPVPGKFEYSPAVAEMLPPGMHTLSVTFTPADTANYASGTGNCFAFRRQGKVGDSLAAPAPIMYGTQLSTRNFARGLRFRGQFEYNPDFGAVLAAGEHKLTVAFTPADTLGYSHFAKSRFIECDQGNSKVKWPMPDPIPLDVALGVCSAQCQSTGAGVFCLYTRRWRKTRPRSA